MAISYKMATSMTPCTSGFPGRAPATLISIPGATRTVAAQWEWPAKTVILRSG